MITTDSIENVNPELYDDVWAIVRRLKPENNPKGLKQVKDLSPSEELLEQFLKRRDEGVWNKTAFDEEYTPLFLEELKNNPFAKELLNELYVRDKAGEAICLVCFCLDESTCHRSIVARDFTGDE